MAIEFHCDHCGKLIRADDEHGGRRGRCPYCRQSVYIPSAAGPVEPLPIAPPDSAEERERQRLLRETRELERQLLHERQIPGEEPPSVAGTGRGRTGAARGRPEPIGSGAERGGPLGPSSTAEPQSLTRAEIEELVVGYARCMADGRLSEAEQRLPAIRRYMRQADDIMQRLVVDQIPHPQLADVPRPVLAALFKQLREGA